MAATEAGGAEQQQGPEQGALRMRGLPYSATADDILVRILAWLLLFSVPTVDSFDSFPPHPLMYTHPLIQ